MALIFADRIKETTTTTGTDDISLAGTSTGYREFDSVMADGDTCYYCIDDRLGNWEITPGTFTSGTPDVITRAITPISSSNSGAKISFGAGTKDVFQVFPSTYCRQADIVIASATIATTSTTDNYIIAPFTGRLSDALFSPLVALATSDTNYITFSITNLGQAGAGTAAMLAATDANTTKATGGTALAINTLRTLTLTGTVADLLVVKGDRIRVRATATGTLANTVTAPVYELSFTH